MSDVRLQHVTEPTRVRDLLVDVYAEVYADHLDQPFSTVEAFTERLDGHITTPRWECVVGYDGDQPIGYVYGGSLRATTSWWNDLEPPCDSEFVRETGSRTLGIFELMIRDPWRRQGLSRAIHDELLAGRAEERASLAVDHDHPRVRALYESWSYRFVGTHRPPGPEAPLLDLMIRALR